MTRARGPWYERRPEATVAVPCGHEVHLLRWSRGRIILEDHRLTDEELLVQLGAPEVGCVAVLGAWRRRDLRQLPPVLVGPAQEAEELRRWRRGPGLPPAPRSAAEERFREVTTRRVREAFGRSVWARRRGRRGRGDIAVLVSFDDEAPPRVSSWGGSERTRTVEGVEVVVHSRWCTRVPAALQAADGTVVLGLVDGRRPAGEPTPVWVTSWAEGGLRARAAVLHEWGGRWHPARPGDPLHRGGCA